MRRQIHRHEVRPGMFVIGYGSGDFNDPLVRVEQLVLSDNIDQYVPETAAFVLIDTTRAVDLGPLMRGPGREQVPVLTPLHEEIPVAARLYAQAVQLVREFMAAVRMGRSVDCRDALPVLDGLAQSLARNEAAAVTARLRKVDSYVYAHGVNVAVFSLLVGRRMRLRGEELRLLGLAALFHDIGKARVAEAVLNKAGILSEGEYAEAKEHARHGFDILSAMPGLDHRVAMTAFEHHERLDGSGYPLGKPGGDIGTFSRIVAAVDVYDAMVSEKAYRHAVPPATALSMLYQARGTRFCEESVELLVRALGVYPVGSFVRLSTGEHGVVVETNAHMPLYPRVNTVFDARMRPTKARLVDLSEYTAQPGRPTIEESLNPSAHGIDVSRFLF